MSLREEILRVEKKRKAEVNQEGYDLSASDCGLFDVSVEEASNSKKAYHSRVTEDGRVVFYE